MKREARRLRTIRADIEPKASQIQIARLAGLSPKRYWEIENGEGSQPSSDEQRAIAAALGVRPADIAWPARHPVSVAS